MLDPICREEYNQTMSKEFFNSLNHFQIYICEKAFCSDINYSLLYKFKNNMLYAYTFILILTINKLL